MKRMLYLSDLYNYFVSQNKNVKFSSKDDDTTIVVHIDEPFNYSKTEDNDLLMYAPIRLCHTLTNKNKSHISEKSMKDAIPSAYNMPILGYIYKDDEGEYQFAGHEFFVNDEKEVEYEEVPTGVIPESAGLKLIKYDGDDRSYLEGTGIIWRTYSKASEIIEREKELSVSVELCVDELSFDSKNKELVIDKFRFSGVTILGRDRDTGEEIQPGMENSKISIADFSESNNSLFAQNEKVIKLLSELNEKIDGLNIDSKISRKEETEDLMKKNFEKEVTEEEIKDSPSTEVFDGDGGNDGDPDGTDYYDDPKDDDSADEGDDPVEQTEEVVTEGGNDNPTGTNDTPASGGTETGETSETGNTESGGSTSAETIAGDSDDDSLSIPLGQRDDDDTAGESKKKYSIEYTVDIDGIKKTYAASLRDKLMALTTLVNDTYAEDGGFYECDADEDSKTVIFHDYWNDKHFRQLYSVKKGVYTLKGDRTEVFATYLSREEQEKLDEMKLNYSSIAEKLEQYEAEPEKVELLNSADYAQIKDTEEYKKLAERDTYFSMSKDELEEKLNTYLLEYAKGHELKFSATETKKSVATKFFGVPSKKSGKKGRYGGMFNK